MIYDACSLHCMGLQTCSPMPLHRVHDPWAGRIIWSIVVHAGEHWSHNNSKCDRSQLRSPYSICLKLPLPHLEGNITLINVLITLSCSLHPLSAGRSARNHMHHCRYIITPHPFLHHPFLLPPSPECRQKRMEYHCKYIITSPFLAPPPLKIYNHFYLRYFLQNNKISYKYIWILTKEQDITM